MTTRLLIGLLGASLLPGFVALTSPPANAQLRPGSSLRTPAHGRVLFYGHSVTLTIKPAYRAQFLQATAALQAKGVHEKGCRLIHYNEHPALRNHFLLLSEWTSAAAMAAYHRQPAVVAYFEQLAHWLTAPATVRIFEEGKHRTTAIQPKP